MKGTIRVDKNRDYTPISNQAMNDPRLSFGARGILAYLLCKPDDWRMQVNDLINQSPSGRDKVRGMLRELEAVGYLHRECKQGEKGHWVWETVIYESPRLANNPAKTPASKSDSKSKNATRNPSPENPSTDNPFTEKPSPDDPLTENPSVYKVMKGLSNEELNNELKSNERVSGEIENSAAIEPTLSPAPLVESSLNPNPNDAPDTTVLISICNNLNVLEPKARDVAAWPAAVSIIRKYLSNQTPEQRAQSILLFKELWCSGIKPTGEYGSPRSLPYLSQVVANFVRVMDDHRRRESLQDQPRSETQAERCARLDREERNRRRPVPAAS